MSALTYEARHALRQLVGEAMRRRYRRELRMNLWGDDRPKENRNARRRALREAARGGSVPVPPPVPRNLQVVPSEPKSGSAGGSPGTTKWFPQVVLTCTCTSTCTCTKSKNTSLSKQAGSATRARTRERPDSSPPGLLACRIEGGQT
jgi:hypothetical protein